MHTYTYTSTCTHTRVHTHAHNCVQSSRRCRRISGRRLRLGPRGGGSGRGEGGLRAGPPLIVCTPWVCVCHVRMDAAIATTKNDTDTNDILMKMPVLILIYGLRHCRRHPRLEFEVDFIAIYSGVVQLWGAFRLGESAARATLTRILRWCCGFGGGGFRGLRPNLRRTLGGP